MSLLTGHRVESYRYELLDRNDNVVGLLGTVAPGGKLDSSIATEIRDSGSIELANTGTDWLTSRVRVSYLLEGQDPVPLITAVPRAPGESHTATGATVEVELYDKTVILQKDTYGASYALPAGTNIIDAVADVITSTGVPARDLLLTPSALTLANPKVFDADETKLSIVNELLDTANCFSLRTDGYGRFIAEPYTDPTTRGVAWDFRDDSEGVYLPEWALDADLSDIPNKFICVSTTDGTEPALIATATDENPASRFSFQERGRWITRTDLDVDTASQAVLNAMAARRLAEAQQLYATVEIKHPWLPFGLNDVVRFTNNDFSIRATVIKQSMTLKAGGLITSTLRRLL